MRNLYGTEGRSCTVQLDEFLKFCRVDLRLSARTVERNKYAIRRILEVCGPNPTRDQLRDFLASIENESTRDNYIKAMRAYFRDFLGSDVASTFKLSCPDLAPAWCPSKKMVQEFYYALESEKERALYLMYATSGLRRGEVLSLSMNDFDLESRTIFPTKSSSTKRTWYTFFNEECQSALREYLKTRRDLMRSNRLFVISSENYYAMFKLARERTGLNITPKVLRFWFANEMARLGVPDRFIDAFQGRIPRSILARHYTDYSLENLKAIYDKAGLKVLS